MQKKPTSTSKKKIRTHAVAGCVAGLASTLALQPLDVVKTRMQVQDGVARSLGAATNYRGTAHALASIARSEGWLALYAGLAPALLGAGLSWGTYFAAYSAAKERWVTRLDGSNASSSFPFPSSSLSSSASSSSSSSSSFSLPAAAHMAAAAEAGALVALLTNPVWVVKTRLQLQARGGMPVAAAGTAGAAAASPSSSAAATATGRTVSSSAASAAVPASAPAAGAARSAVPPRPPPPPLRRYGGGVRGTIRAIVAEEGVSGLYRGLLPSLLLVSHGAIQFAVYEEFKSLARANNLWLAEGGGGGGGGGSGSESGGGSCSSDGSGSDTRPLASLAVAAAGAASKVAACVATYPAQVLRARLQQKQLPPAVAAVSSAAAAAGKGAAAAVLHPPPAASAAASSVVRYDRVRTAFKTILAREGVGGFYKGLSPTLLRVVPQSALTFMAYERVLSMLQAAVDAAAAAAKER